VSFGDPSDVLGASSTLALASFVASIAGDWASGAEPRAVQAASSRPASIDISVAINDFKIQAILVAALYTIAQPLMRAHSIHGLAGKALGQGLHAGGAPERHHGLAALHGGRQVLDELVVALALGIGDSLGQMGM
jgi:hypothetical protein